MISSFNHLHITHLRTLALNRGTDIMPLAVFRSVPSPSELVNHWAHCNLDYITLTSRSLHSTASLLAALLILTINSRTSRKHMLGRASLYCHLNRLRCSQQWHAPRCRRHLSVSGSKVTFALSYASGVCKRIARNPKFYNFFYNLHIHIHTYNLH